MLPLNLNFAPHQFLLKVLAAENILPPVNMVELAEKLGLAEDHIHLVLNRADSNVGLEAAEIERALRHPVAFKVVSGGRPVVQSVNKGTPLVIQQPSHPFSQQVSRIAEYFSS